LKRTFRPENVFDGNYAGFHSLTYRARYAEFLKSDFPRTPLTSGINLFRVLCGKSAELVTLRLVESPKLAKPTVHFPPKGSVLVEKGFPKYVAPGDLEPFVEAASRRQRTGGINPACASLRQAGQAGHRYSKRVAFKMRRSRPGHNLESGPRHT
jgi:hypothetical protein